jgi:hypothetical protein
VTITIRITGYTVPDLNHPSINIPELSSSLLRYINSPEGELQVDGGFIINNAA